MKLSHLNEFTKGWVVGPFEPSLLKINSEIGLHRYKTGDQTEPHFHKESNEINLIVDGICIFSINGVNETLKKDDILVVEVNEIAQFTAITDCTVLCIKEKYAKGDKYNITGETFAGPKLKTNRRKLQGEA